jgi:hypothetical protein
MVVLVPATVFSMGRDFPLHGMLLFFRDGAGRHGSLPQVVERRTGNQTSSMSQQSQKSAFSHHKGSRSWRAPVEPAA